MSKTRELIIMLFLFLCLLWVVGRIGENIQSYFRPDYPLHLKWVPSNEWRKHGTPAKIKTIKTNHTLLKYEVDLIVNKYAKQYGHSPKLIQSIIKYESLRAVGGDYSQARIVRSHAGAVGFMQIMPIHAKLKGLPVSALEDPELNIKLGCSILSEQKSIARSRGLVNITAEALRQYNQGAGSAKNWIKHRSGYKNWFKYVYPIMEDSEVLICQY